MTTPHYQTRCGACDAVVAAPLATPPAAPFRCAACRAAGRPALGPTRLLDWWTRTGVRLGADDALALTDAAVAIRLALAARTDGRVEARRALLLSLATTLADHQEAPEREAIVAALTADLPAWAAPKPGEGRAANRRRRAALAALYQR